MLKKLMLPLAVAGMFACLSTTAYAQATVANQPVFFTFANPVMLPGHITLQPGQYEFRQANTRADREVIEIWSKDTAKHVTTVMAVSAHLTDAQAVPEKAEVRFYETAANQPAPVRSWWYPGIRDGHEFIYPRDEAEQIAKLNPDGVLTTDEDKIVRLRPDGSAADPAMRTNTESARANAVAEPRADASARPAPAPAPTPAAAPAPRVQAQAQAEPMPAPEPAGQMAQRTELPRTASPLPLIGALGVFSLVAGFALLRRKVS